MWNSARCDTAEVNVFAFHSRFVFGGPGRPQDLGKLPARVGSALRDPRAAQAALLHQDVDLRSQRRGVRRHGAVVCGVQRHRRELRLDRLRREQHVHPGVHEDHSRRPAHGRRARQYFFRQIGSDNTSRACCPDTNSVSPQVAEGSTDGHRWQEFSVLPDRWKDPAYRSSAVPDLRTRTGLPAGRRQQRPARQRARLGERRRHDRRDIPAEVGRSQRLARTRRRGPQRSREQPRSGGTHRLHRGAWRLARNHLGHVSGQGLGVALTTQAGSLGSRLSDRSNAQTGPKSSRQDRRPSHDGRLLHADVDPLRRSQLRRARTRSRVAARTMSA